MPDIIQKGHADKVEYGWWESKRGHVFIPRTLKDKNNYVLAHDELAAYDLILTEMKRDIEAEAERVSLTLRAMRRGYCNGWERSTPVLISFAHMLKFMVTLAKHKLSMMKLFIYTTGRFTQEQKANGPTSDQQDHQSPSEPDSR